MDSRIKVSIVFIGVLFLGVFVTSIFYTPRIKEYEVQVAVLSTQLGFLQDDYDYLMNISEDLQENYNTLSLEYDERGLFIDFLQYQYELFYGNITVEQAKRLIDSNLTLTILDVRSYFEVSSEGYIENSLLIPIDDFSVEELEFITYGQEFGKILVYCQSGGRSLRAMDLLSENGFTVYNMVGGLNDWKEHNYPVIYLPDGGCMICSGCSGDCDD